MTALDWVGLRRSGLLHLGLQPAQFWSLTPVELMLMLGIDQADVPMGRARLEELSRRFPDQNEGKVR